MFSLGQVVTTNSINNFMSSNLGFHFFIQLSVNKHRSSDFGDLCKEDINSNIIAIKEGYRILSAYKIPEELSIGKEKIYVITEADRSATTILFPDEY